MYIQSLVKSFAIFCMVLIIGLPISLAVEIVEPEWVEWVGPETAEEFVEGEWADFAINVKYYEPRPLTSSTIEKGNAPIYIHLMAIPAVPMTLPRIQSVSVREVGTRVLAGGIRYVRPALYSWDDFGYLIVRLKQIPKEEDVPDSIIANLTARFRYETEVIPGLIGGAIGKTLKEIGKRREKETESDYWNRIWNEVSGEEENMVFREKGYIVAKTIGKEHASFVLFNSRGEARHIPAIKIGEERGPYTLVTGSRKPEDLVRIRVDKIEEGKATITLLAGVKKGESEVNFKLILPVDKRPFDLTPQEIQKHMEWTNKTIEKLDKMIDNLNDVVDWFYTACLVSTGIVIVSQFIGIGRVATVGEKAVGAATGESILDITGAVEGEEAGEIIERLSTDELFKKYIEEVEVRGYAGYEEEMYAKWLLDTLESADEAEYWANKAELAAKEAKAAAAMAVSAKDAGDVDAAQVAAKNAEDDALEAANAATKADAAYKAVKDVATDVTSPDVTRAVIAANHALGAAKDAEYWADKAELVAKEAEKAAAEAVSETDKEEEKTVVEKKPGTTGKVGKTIFTDNFRDEKLIVVPIHDFSKLSKNLFPIVNEYKDKYKDRMYAAYNDKKGLTFFILEGREIDCGKKIGDDVQDKPITQTYGPGTSQYRVFSIEIGKVQRAQLSGETKVKNVFGSDYKLDTKKLLVDEAALNCEEFMSPGQCKIIFNFCDPVICPTSRCDFGGTYRLKQTVQESGLFASVFACWHNIREGVLVPVCLSGIRDSLENIKSYIQSYHNCLEIKVKEGRSVGFCDMARSVFICEILWRHVLDPAFGYLIGKTTSRKSGAAGGGEYNRLGRAVESSKKAGKYFVEGYAKNIIAAYEGKVSEAVGTELCRSAIVGKFPNFGEILEEIAEGGKPTQYTARFEEHSYGAGKSRYFGYYHIHVGSKTETVRYAVYLKDCGEMEKLDVGQTGEIKGGDFADETFEQIGPVGCKHICLVINGENKCAFGKVLSSSSAIEGLTESYVARQAGKKITSERECVPSYENYLGAAVNRQCIAKEVGKPGDNWMDVGTCREGVVCWAEINTEDKGIKERIHKIACGEDKVCNRNQKCIINGKEEKGTPILDSTDVCCEGGRCDIKNKALFTTLEEFIHPLLPIGIGKEEWAKRTGLSYDDDKKLLDRWYDRGLKNTGNLDYYYNIAGIGKLIHEEKRDGVYYYLGVKFLYDADYENAEKCFNKIKELRPKSEYYKKGKQLLGLATGGLSLTLYQRQQKEVAPKAEEEPEAPSPQPEVEKPSIPTVTIPAMSKVYIIKGTRTGENTATVTLSDSRGSSLEKRKDGKWYFETKYIEIEVPSEVTQNIEKASTYGGIFEGSRTLITNPLSVRILGGTRTGENTATVTLSDYKGISLEKRNDIWYFEGTDIKVPSEVAQNIEGASTYEGTFKGSLTPVFLIEYYAK